MFSETAKFKVWFRHESLLWLCQNVSNAARFWWVQRSLAIIRQNVTLIFCSTPEGGSLLPVPHRPATALPRRGSSHRAKTTHLGFSALCHLNESRLCNKTSNLCISHFDPHPFSGQLNKQTTQRRKKDGSCQWQLTDQGYKRKPHKVRDWCRSHQI